MNDVRQMNEEERPFDGQSDAVGVVLHEERLRAGVQRVEAGRVEVRKRIVTEEVTVTVPVRREVVDVVRVFDDGSEEALEVPASAWQPQVEYATGDERSVASHGHDAGDVFDVERSEQHARAASTGGDGVIVLHEERPVIATKVYAVERLRLDVTGETQVVPVSAEVKREVVEIEGVEGVGAQGRPGERRI